MKNADSPADLENGPLPEEHLESWSSSIPSCHPMHSCPSLFNIHFALKFAVAGQS